MGAHLGHGHPVGEGADMREHHPLASLQGGRPGGDPVKTPQEMVEHASEPDNAMNMIPAAPFMGTIGPLWNGTMSETMVSE